MICVIQLLILNIFWKTHLFTGHYRVLVHYAQYTPPTRLNCRVVLSWVVSAVCIVYAPVGCRDPVYNSAANGVGLEVAGSRLVTAASWLTFTPPTRCNSTSLTANCSDSSRLSPKSCEFNTHSTVELRWRQRCVLGFTSTFTYSNAILTTKTIVVHTDVYKYLFCWISYWSVPWRQTAVN